jgi:hypothetical protein
VSDFETKQSEQGKIATSFHFGSGGVGRTRTWEFGNQLGRVIGEFRIAGCLKGKLVFWIWMCSEFVDAGEIIYGKREVDKANKAKKFKEDFQIRIVTDRPT